MLYDPYLNDKKAEAYEARETSGVIRGRRRREAAVIAAAGGGGDDAAVGPMEGIQHARRGLTGAAAEIPIGLHRAVQRGGDVLALELVKYSIVTDEAERIAIDDLMRGRGGTGGSKTPAGQYLSHLRGMADRDADAGDARRGGVEPPARAFKARLVVSSDACPFSPRSLSIPTHAATPFDSASDAFELHPDVRRFARTLDPQYAAEGAALSAASERGEMSRAARGPRARRARPRAQHSRLAKEVRETSLKLADRRGVANEPA